MITKYIAFFFGLAGLLGWMAPASGAKPVIVDGVCESVVYKLKDGTEKDHPAFVPRTGTFRHAVRYASPGGRGRASGHPRGPVQPAPRSTGEDRRGVTKGYIGNSSEPEIWALKPKADARLRFWDPDQPLLEPGTFVYPAKQRWFASDTQMANDPCYVDGGEDPESQSIYYHYGLDIGGYDHWVPVVAATDGEVISSGVKVSERLTENEKAAVSPRYDVVYIRDGRGWVYRYSHFSSILPHVQVGQKVKMGEWIGILGKEGASGGWSHLHFDIQGTEGSERGLINGYPFLVEAYLHEHRARSWPWPARTNWLKPGTRWN